MRPLPFVVNTPYADMVIRRVDEVLRGEDCAWLPAEDERKLLKILRIHVGKGQAISRATLMQALEKNDRAVRDLVNSLRVNFRVAVGSSSVAGASGYYLIASQDEVAEVKQMFFTKARSLFAAARAIVGKQEAAEILGQLELEFNSRPKEVAHAG